MKVVLKVIFYLVSWWCRRRQFGTRDIRLEISVSEFVLHVLVNSWTRTCPGLIFSTPLKLAIPYNNYTIAWFITSRFLIHIITILLIIMNKFIIIFAILTRNHVASRIFHLQSIVLNIFDAVIKYKHAFQNVISFTSALHVLLLIKVVKAFYPFKFKS